MAHLSQLYLLDTNIATYLATGRFPNVRERYLALRGTASFAISAVTAGELHYGIAKRPSAVRLRMNVVDVFEQADVLPWDSDVALAYGELRAKLEVSGIGISPLDLMIAGHAYALGATLVTHDTALKRLNAHLTIEDWVHAEQEPL